MTGGDVHAELHDDLGDAVGPDQAGTVVHKSGVMGVDDGSARSSS